MTEDEKKKRIARDGETVRVPMLLMDSQQRIVAARTVKDASHHRPNEAKLSDVERARRVTLIAMDKQRVSNRWKGSA